MFVLFPLHRVCFLFSFLIISIYFPQAKIEAVEHELQESKKKMQENQRTIVEYQREKDILYKNLLKSEFSSQQQNSSIKVIFICDSLQNIAFYVIFGFNSFPPPLSFSLLVLVIVQNFSVFVPNRSQKRARRTWNRNCKDIVLL